MIESLLANLETLLLAVFGVCALIGAALMLVLREPMRVALALISTMVFLGGIYGLLGVHFIAAFQVLIYVGAVMVFIVYVIMLLDPRDSAVGQRYSSLLVPGALGCGAFIVVLGMMVSDGSAQSAQGAGGATFTLNQFSSAFLNEYWLEFELTSVLLLAAIVAAIAVIQVNRSHHG